MAQQPSPKVVNATATGDVLTITAHIKAVNPARRTVTVKGPLGRKLVMRADDTVKKFDEIKPGDEFVVKYAEAVLLKLEKSAGGPNQRKTTTGQVTARAEAEPAMAKAEETMNAKVTKIDMEHICAATRRLPEARLR